MAESPAEKHLKNAIFRISEEIKRQELNLAFIKNKCKRKGVSRESAIKYLEDLIEKKKGELVEKKKRLKEFLKRTNKF